MRRLIMPSTKVLLIALLVTGPVASSDSGPRLPRTSGNFTLGMPIEQFQSITGVRPEECPQCKDGELFASLPKRSSIAVPGVSVPDVEPAPDERNTTLFFFYREKLYRIETGENYGAPMKPTRDRYSNLFGRQPQSKTLKSGSVEMKWEDDVTVFSVWYESGTDKILETVYSDKTLDPRK